MSTKKEKHITSYTNPGTSKQNDETLNACMDEFAKSFFLQKTSKSLFKSHFALKFFSVYLSFPVGRCAHFLTVNITLKCSTFLSYFIGLYIEQIRYD